MVYELSELLEFTEIRKYLELAIGKKKAKIGNNLTLEQKIKSINLSQYLRGVALFLEYSKNFKTPSDIVAFWKANRNNDEKVSVLFDEITNFPVYLKSELQLGDTTAIAYQAHIRGFLSNNNIVLKFKNFKPKTAKRQEQNKLGITYEILKDFAEKIKTYITDIDLKVLCEAQHRTGLAFKEIADITFGTLRAKDFSVEYVPIAAEREKTSVDYANFLSPSLKMIMLDYMRLNTDMKDSDKLFGNDTEKAYHNLFRRFNTAYDKCVENHFPQFKKTDKQIFTLHSFRAIFKSACDKLRIPNEHRDLFIAHTSDKMTNYDLISDELLSDYKIIENELFGKKTSDNKTIDDVFDILKELVNNKGKAKSLFRSYQDNQTIDMTNELKGAILLEQLKMQIINEVKESITNDVKAELQKQFANLSLKEFLVSLK